MAGGGVGGAAVDGGLFAALDDVEHVGDQVLFVETLQRGEHPEAVALVGEERGVERRLGADALGGLRAQPLLYVGVGFIAELGRRGVRRPRGWSGLFSVEDVLRRRIVIGVHEDSCFFSRPRLRTHGRARAQMVVGRLVMARDLRRRREDSDVSPAWLGRVVSRGS